VERRAEGRLINARRTLRTLDEKEGVKENYLSLDPGDKDSFPPGWYEALSSSDGTIGSGTSGKDGMESHLRKQVKTERLSSRRPEESDESDDDGLGASDTDPVILEPELREKCLKYLSMPSSSKLSQILIYLRTKHLYCFWCGAQYKSLEEMGRPAPEGCPGSEEEDHD